MNLEIINNICKTIIETDIKNTNEPIFLCSNGILSEISKKELKLLLSDLKSCLASDIKYKDTVKALDNYLNQTII